MASSITFLRNKFQGGGMRFVWRVEWSMLVRKLRSEREQLKLEGWSSEELGDIRVKKR